jgi:hypothetical protein
MFQIFHMDVAKVDQDVTHVASVSEACCKCLFKMFHLFSDVCYKRSDLDVVYVFTHMLQEYIPNVSAVSFLCCSKCLI